MVTTNSRGEICDLLDVSQFSPGKSAYMCVAYSAALIKYAGLPGRGPSGTALEASNLAFYWYGRLEGGTDTANKNGMSLDAAHTMLGGMGLRYQAEELQGDHAHDLALLKLCLSEGMPLLVCGAETGMHDMGLGDRVPYNWTPTGNHAIVVSGMTFDGNLLVHDCANVDGQGNVRPGPRIYDANTMQMVSVTAIHLQEDDDMPTRIDLNTPGLSNFFAQSGNGWLCKQTGKLVHGAILEEYQQRGWSAMWGLPKSNETPIESFPQFAYLLGKGVVVQWFERMCAAYDPEHLLPGEPPPNSGAVYPLQLFGEGPGIDPRLRSTRAELVAAQAEVAQLKAQPVPAIDSRIGKFEQIKAIAVS